MKKLLSLLIVALMLVMTLASCDLLSYLPIPLPQPEPQPTHSCESVCAECGKCLDAECAEDACADKCEGHEPSACEHVYDNACDTDCNVCGATRTTTHAYDNDCDTDCNVCGEEREVGEHAYDNACDTDCNTCGATREVGEHAYDNACDTDCNVCGATRTTAHAYDNDCDADCNVCGATRTTTHAYDNDCDTDCNVCGATRTTTHAYDNNCDTDCNVCGEERATEHQYEAVVTDPTCFAAGYTTHTCSECGDNYTDTPTEQLTHVDENGDEMCDHNCGTEMPKPRYTVTLNYGSKSKTVEVKEGNPLTAEDLALDSKYPFALVEWQKDGVAFDTSAPVTEAVELTAVLASHKIFETPEAWNNTSKATSSEIDDASNPDNKILQFVTTGNYNGIYSQNLDLYEDFADVRYIYLKVRSNVDTKITLRFFKENNAYASTYMQGGENITGNGKWQIVCVDLDSLTTFSKEEIKLVFIMSGVAATVEIDEIYFAREEIEIELPKSSEILTFDFETEGGWFSSNKVDGAYVAPNYVTDAEGNKAIEATVTAWNGVFTQTLNGADLADAKYIYVKVKTTAKSTLSMRIYSGTGIGDNYVSVTGATVAADGEYHIVRFDISDWSALTATGTAFDKIGMKTMLIRSSVAATLTFDEVIFASEELTFE